MNNSLESYSFSYVVKPDNNEISLPGSVYGMLADLFNSGYLTVKPIKVTPRYSNNGEADVYNIDIDFDPKDKTKIENIFTPYFTQ